MHRSGGGFGSDFRKEREGSGLVAATLAPRAHHRPWKGREARGAIPHSQNAVRRWRIGVGSGARPAG